jgi:hypothetical protein
MRAPVSAGFRIQIVPDDTQDLWACVDPSLIYRGASARGRRNLNHAGVAALHADRRA